eukprot:m.33720 g.33720  ORF g.33720 m.33720 type:complete len:602 (+) comp31880_c0_seq1:216-2021(+)
MALSDESVMFLEENQKKNLATVSAVIDGDLELVRRMISQGVEVNLADKDGRPLLVLASWKNNLKLCKFLVRAGARIDGCDRKGRSALHLACYKSCPEVISFLVGQKANVDLLDGEGNSPSHIASLRGHLKPLIALSIAGANFQSRNRRGKSVLDLALEKNATDCIFYLKSSADIEGSDGVSEVAQISYFCTATKLADDLQGSERRCQEECGKLSEELMKLKVAKTELTHQLVQVKQEHKLQAKNLQLKHDSMQQQIEMLSEHQSHLMKEVKDKQDELTSASQQITAQEHEVATLQRQMSLKDCEIAELRNYREAFDIPHQELQIGKFELGSGSFATVNVGVWQGSEVAVKTLHEELLSFYNPDVVKQEVENGSRVRHPHVVSICGWVSSPDGLPQCIVFELLEASLAEVIDAPKTQYLTMREQVDLAWGCFSGIAHLHQFKPVPLLHGDIRPENILVSKIMDAKVGDLGSCHSAGSCKSVGPLTPRYISPERMPKEDGKAPGNTAEADVYSLGASMVHLFTGKSVSPQDIVAHRQKIEHQLLRNLCLKMTCREPCRRPRACNSLDNLDDVRRQRVYLDCPPKRLVKGLRHGSAVELTDKPF